MEKTPQTLKPKALFIYPAKYEGKIFAGCRKVLFVQATYKFLHAAKMSFMQLYLEFFLYLYKTFQKMPIMKNSWPNL